MDKEKVIDTLNDIKQTLNDLQKIVDNLEFQIKGEEKRTVYLVKDKYSYDCLMKELEEQGYRWESGVKPTGTEFIHLQHEYGDEVGMVIYPKNNKRLNRSSEIWFKEKYQHEYNLQEYHKEEPLYYARFNKVGNINKEKNYWNLDSLSKTSVLSSKVEAPFIKTKLTKSKWYELGITEEVAEFEEVEND